MTAPDRIRWLEAQPTGVLQELRHQVGAADAAAIGRILDGRPRGVVLQISEKEDKAKPKGKKAHPTGVMDANEQRMALELDARKAAGDVRRWWFEAYKFQIGRASCRERV